MKVHGIFEGVEALLQGIYSYDMKNIEKTDLLPLLNEKNYIILKVVMSLFVYTMVYSENTSITCLLLIPSIKLDRIPTKLLPLTENWSKEQLSFHKLESSVSYPPYNLRF